MMLNDAKEIILQELNERGLIFSKVTARTVSFGRGSGIWVRIHGWKPDPAWDELKGVAKAHGFCIVPCEILLS